MAIRFHLDEHINPAIAEALKRRGIDVTTTDDAALTGAPDLDHIAFALRQRRIIYTCDKDFLRHNAAGIEHCGIIFSYSGARTIGQVIEFLTLVHGCCTNDELNNRVEFL